MLNFILSSIQTAPVETHPYSYMVVDDFLPPHIYQQLSPLMPLRSGYYHAVDMLNKEDAAWRQYVLALNSVEYYQAICQKFDLSYHLSQSNVGLRKKDFATEYVTESYLVCRDPEIDPLRNHPQNNIHWLLPPHVDSQYALISAVHYWGNADDSSGEFLILEKQSENIRFLSLPSTIQYAYPEDFKVVHKIPFKPNRMVLMICSANSWHGIGDRKTKRYSVNMSLELQNTGNRVLNV